MKFFGMEKVSTVDYPGKIVATVFVGGCNFLCDYCHNLKLMNVGEEDLTLEEDEIINYLISRKNQLDGICISGGEPSCWHDQLIRFIKRVKNELGNEFLIKVDTNGSNDTFLENIKDLVDFIALDIKGKDYSEFSHTSLAAIRKSLYTVQRCEHYEVRITMYPEYVKKEDFEYLVKLLQGSKRVVIQQFNPENVYKNKDIKPYNMEILKNFRDLFISNEINAIIR